MKKILIIVCIIILSLPVFAQDSNTTDNKQLISISAFINPEMNIPTNVQKILADRMQKAILKNGLSSSEGERFIMTASINELGKETTATAPVMYVVELEVNFFIGDAVDGILFSQGSTIVKGASDSESKAYLSALKNIKTNDPVFKKMIAQAKDAIVNYYNSKCDIIIADALKLAKNQEYDNALYELTSIPDVCEECYKKSITHSTEIFQQKINLEGSMLLTNARSEWAQGQDIEAAKRAGEFLVQINPHSAAYKEASTLFSQIEKRVLEFDQREWNFKMQQYQDELNLKNAKLKNEATKLQNDKEVKLTRLNNRRYNIEAICKWGSTIFND